MGDGAEMGYERGVMDEPQCGGQGRSEYSPQCTNTANPKQ